MRVVKSAAYEAKVKRLKAQAAKKPDALWKQITAMRKQPSTCTDACKLPR